MEMAEVSLNVVGSFSVVFADIWHATLVGLERTK
jgi:hypothetical protein